MERGQKSREEVLEEARKKLQEAYDEGIKVIFIDETAFTKRSFTRLAYSRKGTNICLNEQAVFGPYKTALAGINSNGGMEYVMIKDGAFNGPSVVDYIYKLR